MPDKTDFYRRLNIGTGASEEAIKKAYRLAVRKTHPDVNRNDGATQLFLDIQEAYKILSDPNRKGDYDQDRDPHDISSGILTAIEYSQEALLRLEEPQVIYSLVDIVSTKDEEQKSADLPLNISLVLDNSTSMKGPRLDILRAATKEIISDLGEDDLVSVISFNDRAKVLLTSQTQPSDVQVETALNDLYAEGGIALANTAADQDIGISGLGIGIEWNDEFVDQLCALTGGQSLFVHDLEQVKEFLEHSVASLKEAFSRRLTLEVTPAPGVKMLSAFRILPEAIPLPIQENYSLGILKKHQPHRVLFEFLVDPIPGEIDRAVIVSGEFIIKKKIRDQVIPITLDRTLSSDIENLEPPPPEIFKAISHLTFYRLQEKAQQDIASGNPGTAYQRLLNLSSHLMAKGEDALAKIAMNEADYIKSHNNFSPTGKKQLKYGTMRLLLPEKT